MAAQRQDGFTRIGRHRRRRAVFACGNCHPAQAGLFEQLFGGFRHALQAQSRCPTPAAGLRPDPDDPRSRAACERAERPARAFCVRTCDGQFFPVHGACRLERGRGVPCFLSGEPDPALYRQQDRRRGHARRRPLCRSRQGLRLSQATGRRLHLQWPRPIRAGAYRREHRSDAAAGRRGGDRSTAWSLSPAEAKNNGRAVHAGRVTRTSPKSYRQRAFRHAGSCRSGRAPMPQR